MGVRKNKNMHFDGSMYIASNIIINQGRAGREKPICNIGNTSIMPLAFAAL